MSLTSTSTQYRHNILSPQLATRGCHSKHTVSRHRKCFFRIEVFVTYPLALGCIICSLAKGGREGERERERERDHNNIHDMGTSELIIVLFTGCLLTPSIIILNYTAAVYEISLSDHTLLWFLIITICYMMLIKSDTYSTIIHCLFN